MCQGLLFTTSVVVNHKAILILWLNLPPTSFKKHVTTSHITDYTEPEVLELSHAADPDFPPGLES